jgi:hypothetical protein
MPTHRSDAWEIQKPSIFRNKAYFNLGLAATVSLTRSVVTFREKQDVINFPDFFRKFSVPGEFYKEVNGNWQLSRLIVVSMYSGFVTLNNWLTL